MIKTEYRIWLQKAGTQSTEVQVQYLSDGERGFFAEQDILLGDFRNMEQRNAAQDLYDWPNFASQYASSEEYTVDCPSRLGLR